MTRDEIMKLEAGRDLDALVSVKVFKRLPSFVLDDFPHFSTDMGAAWEVLKKFPNGRFILELGARQATVELQGYLNEKVRVDGVPEEVAPLAICRAALLAVIEK